MTPDHEQMHASAVARNGRGCLILGAPGAGKSLLAIRMMALGARLIADDRVDLTWQGDRVLLSSPPRLSGLIEARGVGILRHEPLVQAPLGLIVDLDHAPDERLPGLRMRDLLGLPQRIIFGKGVAGLASILCVALDGSLMDPDAPSDL